MVVGRTSADSTLRTPWIVMYHTFLPCINISHFYKVDALLYLLRVLQVTGAWVPINAMFIKFKGNPQQWLACFPPLLPLRRGSSTVDYPQQSTPWGSNVAANC
jgi:hypothetical protein